MCEAAIVRAFLKRHITTVGTSLASGERRGENAARRRQRHDERQEVKCLFFLETDCSLDFEIMPVRARANNVGLGGAGGGDGERREDAVGVCGVSSTRR